ncbi:MAG: hypothetical protein AAGD14_17975 [Planctomycetota bacterium]
MAGEMVPRILEYVGVLFLLCLAATFPFWLAAQIARTEFRSLTSALACTMRLYFYAVCLLCILVTLISFNVGPSDPRDPLMGWIQIGGTIWIVFPCCWRAFRQKGPRMVACALMAIAFTALLFWLYASIEPGFAQLLRDMPYALSRS